MEKNSDCPTALTFGDSKLEEMVFLNLREKGVAVVEGIRSLDDVRWMFTDSYIYNIGLFEMFGRYFLHQHNPSIDIASVYMTDSALVGGKTVYLDGKLLLNLIREDPDLYSATHSFVVLSHSFGYNMPSRSCFSITERKALALTSVVFNLPLCIIKLVDKLRSKAFL